MDQHFLCSMPKRQDKHSSRVTLTCSTARPRSPTEYSMPVARAATSTRLTDTIGGEHTRTHIRHSLCTYHYAGYVYRLSVSQESFSIGMPTLRITAIEVHLLPPI